MTDDRRRTYTGAGLIAAGVLFLMVSNDILLGWQHVWPLFLMAASVSFLRTWHRRGGPWLAFTGVTSGLLGLFFLLFSTGIFGWDRMADLWPMFPTVVGLAFIAEAVVNRENSPSIIVGSTIVLFAAVAFLLESGTVNSRVATPFIRFWPLALILAGVVLLKTTPKKRSAHDPDMETVREVLAETDAASAPGDAEIPPGLDTTILDHVRNSPDPDHAVSALVQGLKASFSRFSWVGMYRLTGDDLLTMGGADFAGAVPEYRDIPLSEGICGAAARERRTIVVPDVSADDRHLVCNASVRSEIAVPVLTHGELVGVLDIDSDQLDAFSPEDRHFLESLVRRAAPYLRVQLPSA